MSDFKWIKSSPLVLSLLVFMFIMSGLIVNCCQLCILILWPFHRSLYRTLIGYLSYLHYAETTFLMEWWADVDITFYGDNNDYEKLGKEHAIVVANHRSDVDWLAGWVLAERTNCLKGAKCFVKDEMKYVPIIGWSWWFGEFGFLKRSWDKDADRIMKTLAALADYPYPFWICIFAEGTRYTDAKYEASRVFAESKGIEPLKHHLLPRPKGFSVTAKALCTSVPAVYDMEIAFPGKQLPTLRTLLRGEGCKIDIYVRRIPMDQVSCNSIEEAGQWCKQLYREKDEFMDHFIKEKRFPFPIVSVPRREQNLLIVISWAFFIGFGTVYVFATMVPFTMTTLVVLASFATLSCLLFYTLIGKTQTKKGSSFGLASNQDKTQAQKIKKEN